MNSELLTYMGLSNMDFGYVFLGMIIIILILIILVIIQMITTSKLKKKYLKFMQGKDAKNLEKDIIGLYEDNKFIKAAAEKNKKDIKDLYKKLQSAFQKLGIVKYDAFRHMGGQLSFSLALLDEDDNGFILNSVHSTEGCYSYTKEVKGGKCSILLSEEEKQALDMAMGIES
ncbi:DUF4446 family protein [Kineothrix sp. MB12-C1]|uniref:DUF4446 family protein n=1 Tax=Kineothrix sp. MB12-C1 TaxID=3070215 RepID=UPI0027D2DBF9|nr:DUF4446 family protein [Kineothrix sp. MB12-C1]WMC91090.1 DUF4446 family protein [Kineothrix sp. MB12-C1]